VVVVWSLSTIIVLSIIGPLSCGWSFNYSRERERKSTWLTITMNNKDNENYKLSLSRLSAIPFTV
jgi:uncharacterized membrane protein YqjE